MLAFVQTNITKTKAQCLSGVPDNTGVQLISHRIILQADFHVIEVSSKCASICETSIFIAANVEEKNFA